METSHNHHHQDHGHDHHHDHDRGHDHGHGHRLAGDLIQIGEPAAENAKPPLDWAQVARKLQETSGRRYWRSLDELADSGDFQRLLEREFPEHASEWMDPVSRRGFMKLMGASLALAGLSACTKMPPEAIVPYVKQPEDLVPGKTKSYATAMPLAGVGLPLLVTSNMYRPTKIEGNPDHPESMGAADAFSQASILGLYDPDRSQTITYLGEIRTWGNFLGAMRAPLYAQKAVQGAGLRFLTETVTSPSMAAQLKALLAAYPQAKWHQYNPVNRDSARAGSKTAFGEYLDSNYKIAQADVILSLDADFLSGAHFPGFLRYAREFVSRRKLNPGVSMNRLYVVESTPSSTGAKADHRLPLRASEIESFAAALAEVLGSGTVAMQAGEAGGQIGGRGGGSPAAISAEASSFLNALARDLQQHRGSCLVIPGEMQSAGVHALAHSMNQTLGNVGRTVIYTETVDANPVEQTESLKELSSDMDAGKVNLLVIAGCNPVYTAPADLNFHQAIRKVDTCVHLSLYHDETSRLSHWHITAAHYLESWGDVRSYDGTVTILQPLIEPLYQGKTAHELLAAFSDQPGQNSYDIVRSYWKTQHPGADYEQFWQRTLHDGFVPRTTLAVKQAGAAKSGPNGTSTTSPIPAAQGSTGTQAGGAHAGNDTVEVIFRPDPSIYDGRFANNGWLQELPKPLSKLTWDNAVLLSPVMAARRGLKTEDVVEINLAGRKVTGPVFVMPGHPDNSVTLHLGYGRSRTGRVGAGAGFNAYLLRSSTAPLFASGATLTKTGERYELALTQEHNLIDNQRSLTGEEAERRHVIRSATLEHFQRDPNFAHEGVEEPSPDMSLYPKYEYTEHKWGMAIDLNSCVGCNACVVACQAENNIPVVGKIQTRLGRAMHWLRIDTYFEGNDLANPAAHFQPLPCMHCENAPCEPVCPVEATVHSTEGLNLMVYNRCVGTRYCSNNCPYKVRHFNFLLYSDFETPSLKLMRNPDVTVRSRGVMEKCTYCVQRITAGRIAAEEENRWVHDGEVVTACQQSCPTEAIVFGNMNDPESRVTKLKSQQRNYALLADLNTRPRTTYIAEVRNPAAGLASTSEAKET